MLAKKPIVRRKCRQGQKVLALNVRVVTEASCTEVLGAADKALAKMREVAAVKVLEQQNKEGDDENEGLLHPASKYSNQSDEQERQDIDSTGYRR